MTLTSSQFSAAIGLSPWCSRQKLFRQMTGRESRDPLNEAMQWGIDHEADAVAGLEMITGRFFTETGPRQCHIVSGQWGSTPDGRDGSTGCEVKCPGKIWEEPKPYYLPQLIGQAYIAGFTNILFSCWTPDEQKVWLYTYDESHWEWLEPLLIRFMESLESDEEPKRAKKPVLPEITLELLT